MLAANDAEERMSATMGEEAGSSSGRGQGGEIEERERQGRGSIRGRGMVTYTCDDWQRISRIPGPFFFDYFLFILFVYFCISPRSCAQAPVPPALSGVRCFCFSLSLCLSPFALLALIGSLRFRQQLSPSPLPLPPSRALPCTALTGAFGTGWGLQTRQ